VSVGRARREASKRLALSLQMQYRLLAEARSEAEVQAAAIELGDTFNTNIEFIINVLRDYGGLEAKFEPMTRRVGPANDVSIAPPVVQTPAIFRAGCDVDMPGRK
jgi:hypothetical protein